MTIDDFEQVYDLWKQASLAEHPFDKEREHTLEMISHNPQTCLVGKKENKIIATALGIYNGHRGWIYRLAVEKKHQKQGYGEQMLKAVEKELQKAGAEAVFLWLSYDNLATFPFYQKNNYIPFTNAIPLRKALKEE